MRNSSKHVGFAIISNESYLMVALEGYMSERVLNEILSNDSTTRNNHKTTTTTTTVHLTYTFNPGYVGTYGGIFQNMQLIFTTKKKEHTISGLVIFIT